MVTSPGSGRSCSAFVRSPNAGQDVLLDPVDEERLLNVWQGVPLLLRHAMIMAGRPGAVRNFRSHPMACGMVQMRAAVPCDLPGN